ncbi:putative transposase YbfD/YdcC [Paraburkholderia sp. WSM4177]|nr:putative transposase YbfD/YdcC [Paraburkholderia sp. WSM4177]MBB5488391.1 putative transposase YbfD/YdcC [Paraburkholderia sp. WSM4180]
MERSKAGVAAPPYPTEKWDSFARHVRPGVCRARSEAQVRTAEKDNEITAFPELLDTLLLKGAIVTIDAMGCQRSIAERIVKAGADYVLACKGNQGTMLGRVQTAFEPMECVPLAFADYNSEHREVEKGHGRIETRRCVASDILTRWQFEPDLWPGLRSIVTVESTREIGDTVTTTERRYYVSSLPPGAARIAHAVRAHWGIENGMHWCLDMAFGEDQCRVRVDDAAQNFAILRRIALNLLRQDRHQSRVEKSPHARLRKRPLSGPTPWLAGHLAI